MHLSAVENNPGKEKADSTGGTDREHLEASKRGWHLRHRWQVGLKQATETETEAQRGGATKQGQSRTEPAQSDSRTPSCHHHVLNKGGCW